MESAGPDSNEANINDGPAETLEEISSRQKKELKNLENDQRAALKKIKGTYGKGKKAKEALAAAEKEHAESLQAMKDRHSVELEQLKANALSGTDESNLPDSSSATAGTGPSEESGSTANAEETSKSKKQSKSRRKKEKARLAEIERERRIAEELETAGPSSRDMELSALMELYLRPAGLDVREVSADGHCLYRAVADQIGNTDYSTIRTKCADALSKHQEEFAPFADLDDGSSGGTMTFEAYVERVRSSSDWGGHLELRALSLALNRSIIVYSADAAPLSIGDDSAKNDKDDPIRVSFHRHYYALGEHYNSVVSRG